MAGLRFLCVYLCIRGPNFLSHTHAETVLREVFAAALAAAATATDQAAIRATATVYGIDVV